MFDLIDQLKWNKIYEIRNFLKLKTILGIPNIFSKYYNSKINLKNYFDIKNIWENRNKHFF